MRKVVLQFNPSTLRSTVELLQADGWEPEGQVVITAIPGNIPLYSMYMTRDEDVRSVEASEQDRGGITIHHEEDIHLFRSIVKKVHDRRKGCSGDDIITALDPHETKFIWGLQASLLKME